MSVTTLLDNDFLGHTQERAQLAQEESQKVMRMFELTHRQKPLQQSLIRLTELVPYKN